MEAGGLLLELEKEDLAQACGFKRRNRRLGAQRAERVHNSQRPSRTEGCRTLRP